MELVSDTVESTDPVAEVRRLRRQLRREQARRQAAESIGERATADLYDSVRELRNAQAELLERADQARVVTELARALRQDFDSAQLVNRAAESVGQATQVDRCDVLLVDAERYSAVRGAWSAGPEAARLPQPASFVDLPESLTSLLLEAAQQLEPLRIDHVGDDRRLDPVGAAEIVEALGVVALAAVPVAVGDEVVGWLLLSSIRPRAWQPRELAICQGVSHDLVASLVQVQAFEQQRESMRRLEELDRAKDAFISTVSHELRTPLTSIVGYLELMSEGGMGELTSDVAQSVTIIERNVGRLRALVEDLLSLSAYDAEQVHLDLRALDLAPVVAECQQTLAPSTAAKDIEVTVVSDSEVPLVLGDRRQLERVLLNLLNNAVKFSHPHGAVTVRLHAEGDDVVLSVVDTGIGIPAAEQDRLFSRFFRSSLSVADEIQGTGLGLALVQSVVEWHGGSVEIESQEGRGTTVLVRLPRAPQEDVATWA
ncbi:GAF domain-containing protein [Nocardioides scoriae]|uniref:histidine kinase n=1 Tax=Nocardioides scoriae TaxID=642780 RepID=A0A1H1QPD6_9ACTN|nr:GAF domain-containing sensor histidine kinase [Nocardioides scoriae]SDS25236.1 GAF domain-containing protein [Nocardioides scoriae]